MRIKPSTVKEFSRPARSRMKSVESGKTAPDRDIPAVERPMAEPRFITNQLLTAVLETIPPSAAFPLNMSMYRR